MLVWRGEKCFLRSLDRIHMPQFEAFRDGESYYATLAHEVTHWTRHGSRLARDFGRERFGDAGYAQEELVAELGAGQRPSRAPARSRLRTCRNGRAG